MAFWKRASIFLSVSVTVLCLTGNLLFLAFDRSDQALGYDHQDGYNHALFLYDAVRQGPDAPRMAGHGHPYTLLYLLTLYPTLLFGINTWTFMSVPTLGVLGILFFGFRLGKRIAGGDPLGGWTAAAALSLTPVVFGLARKYSPWTLVMALYLAVVSACAAYRDDPTPRRAFVISLAAFVGLMAPHDASTQILFAFFALLPMGWVLAEAITSQRMPMPALIRHAAAMFLLPAAGTLLPTFVFPGSAVTTYLAGEASRFGREQGILTTLPAYFLDIFGNLLQPAGTILLTALLVAFPFLYRRRRDLFWPAVPLAGLVLLSLVPKKNSWYILEPLCLLTVVAAMSLAALASRAGGRKGFALLGAFYAMLGTQYAYCSLHQPANPVEIPYLAKAPFDPLDRSLANHSFRNRIAGFVEMFSRTFPAVDKPRLGIVVEASYGGFNLVPYYLRASGLPAEVRLAVLPKAPELGKGLDAVLFVPALLEYRHTTDIIDNEEVFYKYYVEQVAAKMRSVDPNAYRVSPESVRRRIAGWKSSRQVRLPGEMMLFLPGGSPPQAAAGGKPSLP